jgi:DNA-binding CsgD family transcriptional regulator
MDRRHDDPDLALLRSQRLWRARLIDDAAAARWRPGREIAAQLLLHLDDEAACWHLAADWLRELLDADRVDAGPGGFVDPAGRGHGYRACAEVQREPGRLPTVMGLQFEAADPGLQAAWQRPGCLPIREVAQERAMSAALRECLLAHGTQAKLALPLRAGDQPVGLLCADWGRPDPRWDDSTCQRLGDWAAQALGPLLAEARRLAGPRDDAAPAAADPVRPVLTPAELRVARLVARGLSYKEIARQLDRSVATIDHQTRRLREKFGVRSNARLMPLLDRLL